MQPPLLRFEDILVGKKSAMNNENIHVFTL